jgi:hypothetical protein
MAMSDLTRSAYTGQIRVCVCRGEKQFWREERTGCAAIHRGWPGPKTATGWRLSEESATPLRAKAGRVQCAQGLVNRVNRVEKRYSGSHV